MKIRTLMTRTVEACNPSTDLADAAMILWRNDCGILPVVEEGTRKLVGVITDRDICMAACTRHEPACRMTVGSVISGIVYSCREDEDVRLAMHTMAHNQVRRLPVVDASGDLAGMLSINDLLLHLGAARAGEKSGRMHVPDLSAVEVVTTLQAVCVHRAPAPAEAPERRAAVAAGLAGSDLARASAGEHSALQTLST